MGVLRILRSETGQAPPTPYLGSMQPESISSPAQRAQLHNDRLITIYSEILAESGSEPPHDPKIAESIGKLGAGVLQLVEMGATPRIEFALETLLPLRRRAGLALLFVRDTQARVAGGGAAGDVVGAELAKALRVLDSSFDGWETPLGPRAYDFAELVAKLGAFDRARNIRRNYVMVTQRFLSDAAKTVEPADLAAWRKVTDLADYLCTRLHDLKLLRLVGARDARMVALCLAVLSSTRDAEQLAAFIDALYVREAREADLISSIELYAERVQGTEALTERRALAHELKAVLARQNEHFQVVSVEEVERALGAVTLGARGRGAYGPARAYLSLLSSNGGSGTRKDRW